VGTLDAARIAYGSEVERALSVAGLEKTKPAEATCRGTSLFVSVDENGLTVRDSSSKDPAVGYQERLTYSGQHFRYEAANNGALGGSVVAVSPKGVRREVLADTAITLIPVGDRLYVFAGLDHLFPQSGRVHVIEKFDSAPKLGFVTLLPSTPKLVLKQKGP